MTAKKEDIQDYIEAHTAAQLLSAKHGRPIRNDYISKMLHMKKHRIRAIKRHDVFWYHKADIQACTIASYSRTRA